METKTSKDVPVANRPVEDVIVQASERMDGVTPDMAKSDKALDKLAQGHLATCFTYGEALKDCKALFTGNGHTVKAFNSWIIEYTNKGRSTIDALIQVYEHKTDLVNARSLTEARQMIKDNNQDADGNLLTKENAPPKEKSPRLTDAKRITKILAEIAKLDNLPEDYESIIKGIDKLKTEAENARNKAQAEQVKAKKAA